MKQTDAPTRKQEKRRAQLNRQKAQGRRLRTIREMLDLTQQQAAEQCGISDVTGGNQFARWERGEVKMPPTVAAFFDHLDRDRAVLEKVRNRNAEAM